MHSSTVTFGDVEVTPYDGTTPTAVVSRSAGVHGLAGSSAVGAQVAGIITLQSVIRGPRGRGRLFLGGLPTGLLDTDGARWSTSYPTDVVTFFGEMITQLASVNVGYNVVVVSIKHADFHQVNNFEGRRYLGTIKARAFRERSIP
jgi:hypothetical protein